MERLLLRCYLVVMIGGWFAQVMASPRSSDYAALPPLLNQTAPSLVMLVLSVNHELFKEAYRGHSGLYGDGRLDVTYNDRFDYSGYFESRWCYQYTSNHYTPIVQATGANHHFCNTDSAPWSGNFLNWATMSRADVLRKVLFGGKRSVDHVNQTILERAFLPWDVHAFVKVYQSNVTGISTELLTPFAQADISLCNVSTPEAVPEIRVASGVYPRWASTEVRQCQWREDYSGTTAESPSINIRLAQHQAQVAVCVDGKDATTSSNCKQYVNEQYKPVGLLQKYGEGGKIRFGLISGSYDNNISGGILRRNITRLAGNPLAVDDEIDLSTGQFNQSVNGIIQHINTIKIAKYSYSSSRYLDCSTYGIGVSTFKGSVARALRSNRHCSNWGNPLAEMYLEALRYFSGETEPSNQYFSDDDHYFIPGLSYEPWIRPQTTDNACANCSIILLSTGLNSFDTDEFGSAQDVPGINGVAGVHALTDAVGALESLTNPAMTFPGKYLSDKPGGDRQCEEADIRALSDIQGICPELPQLEGGYQIAGLAWHGRKTDLRTDLEGQQSVKSYVVQLGESIPSFTVQVGGKEVIFQPVCQAHSQRSECSLTHVVVNNLSEDGKRGEFLFSWEDSLWGNDYDYDASSLISYCVGYACTPVIGESQIQISVRQEAKNAGAETWYSYTVTGTDQDGIQTPFATDTGSSTRQGAGEPEVRIFNASGDTATQLPKPIWFAAKYGGFLDLDGDGSPGYDGNGDGSLDTDDSREWDTRNNTTGAIGADGLPDNYFLARNPSHLASQLEQVLSDISRRVSSATSPALLSGSSHGVGVLYQALFQPELEVNGKTVQWGGLLHALFVDGKGYLREDGNGNDQLDDYSTDLIVELIYDPNAGQTLVQRYSSDDNGVTRTVTGSLKPLNSLATIWDARKQLATVSDVVSQRTYSALASQGRHLLTWLDKNNNHQVDANEFLPFTSSTFTGEEGYLGVSTSSASNLVNYIRGQEQSSARSRTIDFDSDGITDIWRLGDIIHSTPKLVAAPNSHFDAAYADSSYKDFQNHYLNRRHVIYVGANDGFIHAFNGGFWNESSHGYDRSGGEGEVAHPLGAELWAYTPMNLLPHLQWLPEVDYPHVYFMDGAPLVFDANIFPSDEDHPGGWGTVLVMGMRFGGGAIDISLNSNIRTMRSAYVVLDITNPEKAPVLLGEITHPDLGFTTSQPELVKMRVAGTGASGEKDWSNLLRNDWYLVFGSGPGGNYDNAIREALDQGKSGQSLGVFIYDLKSRSFVSGFDPLVTSYSAAYAGHMASMDWNNDYQDDHIYFGIIETGGTKLDGQLMRLKLNTLIGHSTLDVFLENAGPIISKPLVVSDKNSHWIYGGTGRLITSADNRAVDQNFFYGVQEPVNSSKQFTYTKVNAQALTDTGNVEVLTNGTVRQLENGRYSTVKIDDLEVGDFENLKSVIKGKSGWKRVLKHDGLNPSGRSINQPTRLFSQILFTEYVPPVDSCSIDGDSSLYSLYYLTGTAAPEEVLGTRLSSEPSISSLSLVSDEVIIEAEISEEVLSLGRGFASSPVIHHGEDGQLNAIIQGAGGSIIREELNYRFSSGGRQSWWQIFDIPWGD